MPWWDQWGSEGEVLITPWLQHGEFWKNMLVPHSEHRIAPTKALNLALTIVGGQWDARLQCVVNALLFALLAVVLLNWVRRKFDLFWSLTATVLITFLLSLPLAVENILGGFQSVFVFLLGLSLAAIYCLINSPAGSRLWLLGLGAGCLSLLNMGSGFFFSIPVIGVTTFRLWKTPRRLELWVTLLVCLIFLAVGWYIRPVSPWQNVLHAKNATDFLLCFVHCLAWPKSEWIWFSVLIWLPWAILAFRWLRSPADRSDPAKTFILAGGTWVILQLIAVSYARGSGGGYPATRYVELLTFGLLCCFLSIPLVVSKQRWRALRLPLYTLSVRVEPGPGWSRAPVVFGVLWSIAVATVALYQTGAIYETTLPITKAHYLAAERNMQGYLITNDFNRLRTIELPLFAGEPLARILAPPEIRRVLPVSMRAPILIYSSDEPDAFQLNGTSPETDPLPDRWFWGSYGASVDDGPARWQSEVIPVSSFAYWKFEVTGALGKPGSSLQLVSERTGKVLSNIAPTKPAGTFWRAAYTRAPSEPARLVARSDSPSAWFAFSEPIEMSGVSYWTWKMVKQGSGFQAIGLVFAATAAVGLISSRRQNQSAALPVTRSDLVEELR